MLTRFVSRQGNAWAIYKAILPDGAHRRRVDIIIAFGDWDEAASPRQRVTFALQMWADETMINVSIVDGELAWKPTFLRRLMQREEALRHPWLQHAYDLSDQIALRDAAIVAYLDKPLISFGTD